MRMLAALPFACLVAAVAVPITPAMAQKASPPPAPQTAPASLPSQADVQDAATAARAWMEHVVGGILEGSPTDDRPAPPPRRAR